MGIYDKLGKNQKRILLLLSAGVALSFATSPKSYWKVVGSVAKEWRAINRRALREAIQKLYESKLVSERHHSDGTISLIITEAGKKKILRYSLDSLSVKKPVRWDRKWRMILFDIPEKHRKLRDAFRFHLKRMDFIEFQKSVFVYPYECKDEVDFLIEYYQARKYIRYIIAESMDNELALRTHFHLS